MSKIKILETNKSLLANAQNIFNRILEMQTEADGQIRDIKTIESKILDIEKVRNEKARAEKEEQQRMEEEARRMAEQKAAEEKAAAEQKTAPEIVKATEETPKPEVKEEESAKAAPEKKEQPAAPAAACPQMQQPQRMEAKTKPSVPPKQAASRQAVPQKQEAKEGQKKQERMETKPAKKFANTNAKPGGFEHGKKTKKQLEDERAKRPKIKERVFNIDDDDFPKGSRKRHKKQQQPKVVIEPIKIEKAVITEETISVKLFSEKIGKPVSEILKKLLLLGMMSTINSQIDFDTATLVAGEFGIELEQKIEKTAEDILIEEAPDTEEQLLKRPPIVTIMGHVDHGKTSLLDKIRQSKVTEGEAGGITQHIGAYQVELNGEKITFIDTPGHEAFTAMRARGAQVTDIAIIVVAADDGIMPQTVEAINHAKSADVPIIVAVNKIDRPNANVQKIMQELTEHDLLPEEWGGQTIVVPVSAKTGEGIEKLLEMILLVAEVQELKANPDRLAKGTIVEAQLDKGRGPVATVLVETGTLRTGDTIIAGTAYGRVRAMVNDLGKTVNEAFPSQPVEVIGFSEVPAAGDILHAAPADKLSKQVAEERKDKQKAEMLKKMSKVSLDDLFNQIAEGQIKDLNIVIKADVQGSVEAVRQSLEKLSNEEVRVRAIHCGVGAITETDVMLASAANAIIIGFNVRPDNMAQTAAEHEKVDIRLYRIIYKAIEDITAAMKGMLEPEFEELVIGHAEVRQTFKVSAVGTIAGCYVTDGLIRRNAQARLLRDNVVIYEGALSSLKRFKDDAKEVAQGYECGLSLERFDDIKEGDVVECFEMHEIAR
ncbi:translation initiation factor IF-2 [Christensenella sp. NSJ-35]|uniref:Translation initiation factor IF-2 n=2 Tax=Christensenella tenuis TaxID=2763033 RepID=A0ABR7EBR8_9FIRM|nr:translation initiation factor IF-2 [Christensenella tenuis]MBC5647223.1 translation initiation factor IF-2 [Christensenella tenuis]